MDSIPSTPSSDYKPLNYKLEQFIDETLGDISTPVPTPTTSVHLEIKNDTIQNIIEQVWFSLPTTFLKSVSGTFLKLT